MSTPSDPDDRTISSPQDAADALADWFVNADPDASGDLVREMIDRKRGKK